MSIIKLFDHFQALEPDPILKLRRIVGFGGSTFKDVSTYDLEYRRLL